MKRKFLPSVVLALILSSTLLVNNSQSQWVQSDGIYGGTVYSYAINGSKIFAGTGLGVYTSTNNGSYWTRTTFNQTVNAFGVNGNNIFAGTGDANFIGSAYLSTDNGSTWNQTSLTNRTVYSFVVSGSNIFAGTYYNGVYLSTNNGSSWNQTTLNNLTVLSLSIIGNTIFAGTRGSGVYVSTNNGTSWSQTTLNTYYINSLVASGNIIYAGTNAGNVYKSTNNGSSWTQSSLGLANCSIVSLLANGSNIYAGTTTYPSPKGVYLSTNNGSSWTQTSLNNQDIYCLAMSGSYLFAGIWLSSNNGTSWSPIALNHQSIYSFASNGSTLFTSTYGAGVYRSTNNGLSWLQTSLNNQTIYSLAANGNNIFAGSGNVGVYRSTDNGASWAQTSLNTVQVNDFVISGTNIFAGTGGGTSLTGVYISSNNGTSWTQTSLNNKVISKLAVSGGNILAGAGNSGLFLSTNNGSSWSQIPTFMSVNSLAVTGNIVFCSSSGGIYCSTNNGLNWFLGSTSLPTVAPALLASGRNIFAGTSSGIYLSSNNGTNWILINEGLNPVNNIKTLLISNNYIMAGTNNYAVWNRNINDFLPLAPILYNPSNSTVGNPLNFNLIWKKTVYASEYNLVLATDINFSNIVLNDTTITDTLKSISNLSPLTYYYWKVKAKSIAGWGAFSSVFIFKTYGSPTQVILAFPENNALNQPKNLNLKWFKSFDQVVLSKHNNGLVNKYLDFPDIISNYWLEIATNEAFTNIILRDSSVVDSIKLVYGVLNDTTSYWWRVKAKNQAGWSTFSTIFKFTTGVTGIQNISSEIPSKFSVSQNYPNPFNPTTSIRFDIASSTFARLVIYDVMGREIKILVNEILTPGTYQVTLDGVSLNSGVYFYRLITDDFTETKRMLLIK
jgi:hypothetical protein